HTTSVVVALLSTALLGVAPLGAQQGDAAGTASGAAPSGRIDSTGTRGGKGAGTPKAEAVSESPPIVHQHMRPVDQRGINMFETPKLDTVPYTGFKLGWGASFTQQFQDLHHTNGALPRMADTVNLNQLVGIGAGFNNA